MIERPVCSNGAGPAPFDDAHCLVFWLAFLRPFAARHRTSSAFFLLLMLPPSPRRPRAAAHVGVVAVPQHPAAVR
eukprot:218281-Chlamydomonas_euryale.AAC.3